MSVWASPLSVVVGPEGTVVLEVVVLPPGAVVPGVLVVVEPDPMGSPKITVSASPRVGSMATLSA